MNDDHGGAVWEAFVIAMLAAGPVVERRSRYGDKPALFSASREIAHLETPGVIDVRITRAGWSQVKDHFSADPVVRRDPSRRDSDLRKAVGVHACDLHLPGGDSLRKVLNSR
jgi:hypothetical protein